MSIAPGRPSRRAARRSSPSTAASPPKPHAAARSRSIVAASDISPSGRESDSGGISIDAPWPSGRTRDTSSTESFGWTSRIASNASCMIAVAPSSGSNTRRSTPRASRIRATFRSSSLGEREPEGTRDRRRHPVPCDASISLDVDGPTRPSRADGRRRGSCRRPEGPRFKTEGRACSRASTSVITGSRPTMNAGALGIRAIGSSPGTTTVACGRAEGAPAGSSSVGSGGACFTVSGRRLVVGVVASRRASPRQIERREPRRSVDARTRLPRARERGVERREQIRRSSGRCAANDGGRSSKDLGHDVDRVVAGEARAGPSASRRPCSRGRRRRRARPPSASRKLGGRVAERPDERPGLGHRRDHRAARRAEVGDLRPLRPAVGQEHVRRLQVTVDDPALVGGNEPERSWRVTSNV